MPTPVGPVPPDPDDPDLWPEWDEPWPDDGSRRPRSHWSRPTQVVAAVLLIGFVYLMVFR